MVLYLLPQPSSVESCTPKTMLVRRIVLCVG
jgi:hypothetical protein